MAEVRLIDAFDLAEEIESMTITVAGKPARWDDAKHVILRVIAEQADIDPESLRPKSKWTLHRNGSGTCHNCHFTHNDVWDMDGWDEFCRHCGAKMEG
jgi:hypothetical protein